MNDRQFHEMDEAWIKKTKTMREKEISDGMLKGFAASVERRITAKGDALGHKTPAWRAAWVPVMAVLVLASVVVLRLPDRQAGSPSTSNIHLTSSNPSLELAQAVLDDEQLLQEEMEILQELGVWEESAEDLLGDSTFDLTYNAYNGEFTSILA